MTLKIPNIHFKEHPCVVSVDFLYIYLVLSRVPCKKSQIKNNKNEADSGMFFKKKTSTTYKKSAFLGYSRWAHDLNTQAWSGVSPCFKNSAELTDCGVDMWRRIYIRSLI